MNGGAVHKQCFRQVDIPVFLITLDNIDSNVRLNLSWRKAWCNPDTTLLLSGIPSVKALIVSASCLSLDCVSFHWCFRFYPGSSSRSSVKEQVICYWSWQLTKPEHSYFTTVTEKEALTVVLVVKEFYPYLNGSSFKLITDHNPLTSLKGQNTIMSSKYIRHCSFVSPTSTHSIRHWKVADAFVSP